MNNLHTLNVYTSFTNTCIMHMTLKINMHTHMHAHTPTTTCPFKYHSPTHTCIHTAAPPTKKLKKEKSRVEKAMEKTIDVFLKSQVEAEERFQKREERWKKEMELEERQRREDRQHQLQMMQMLGQMMQSRPYSPAYSFDLD